MKVTDECNVELMAQALFEIICVNDRCRSAPWSRQPEVTRDVWRTYARSSIAAVRAMVRV